MNMEDSLLDDKLITVRDWHDKVDQYNLPEIFTLLQGDKVKSFEALQAHQQQAWFSFLVQLAAMAVARENAGNIPERTEEWRKLLLKLADNQEAAWCLIVDDLSKPAFMQSPIPEGSLEKAGYKTDALTPDQLDMLVTSKNHDVKRIRILNPKPEHWFFSLISLQTMEGYGGSGNYGIIRMAGRYGTRPLLGVTSKLSWGGRFCRDLKVLIVHRKEVLKNYNKCEYILAWMHPWNGSKKSALNILECDPYIIEICRRVRLYTEKGQIFYGHTTTDTERILSESSGNTGDPWTPIDKKNSRALSIRIDGFSYKKLHDFFKQENYSSPVAFEFHEEEKKDGGYLVAMSIARKMNKTGTEGLHQRIIPVPPKISLKLFKSSDRNNIGEIAKEMVTLASLVQNNVVGSSISPLISSKNNEERKKIIGYWKAKFDEEIDARFFESLWESVDMDQEEAREAWQRILYDEAYKILRTAERSVPVPEIQRWKAVSKAWSIFYSQARKQLEKLFQNEEESLNSIPTDHE